MFIKKTIGNASKTLILEAKLLTDEKIVKNIISAKERGVDTKVILPDQGFYGDLNKKAIDLLKEKGIPVRGAGEGKNIEGVAIAADGKEAVISNGDLNWSSFNEKLNFGLINVNKDEAAQISGLLAGRFEGKPDDASSVNDQHILISANDKREKILGLLSGAEKTIEIITTSIGDPKIRSLLKKKAEKGVNVRVICNPAKREFEKDCLSDLAAVKEIRLRIEDIKDVSTLYINVDNNKMIVGSGNLCSYSIDGGQGIGVMMEDQQNQLVTNKQFGIEWAVSAVDQAERNISMIKKEIVTHGDLESELLGTMFRRAKYGVGINFTTEPGSAKNMSFIVSRENEYLKNLSTLDPNNPEDLKKIAKAYGLAFNPPEALVHFNRLKEALAALKPGESLITFEKAEAGSINNEFVKVDGEEISYQDLIK